MNIASKNLYELTKLLFDRYDIIENPDEIQGKSGKKWEFNVIIQNENAEKFGLFIRDWDREITVTQLRELRRACNDIEEISGGILVCNRITEFSEEFADRFGIQLLSRGRLISKLRNSKFQY
jgi:hypothetical protein